MKELFGITLGIILISVPFVLVYLSIARAHGWATAIAVLTTIFMLTALILLGTRMIGVW